MNEHPDKESHHQMVKRFEDILKRARRATKRKEAHDRKIRTDKVMADIFHAAWEKLKVRLEKRKRRKKKRK